MSYLLIANSEYQEESSKKSVGWSTKNPLSNCHRSKSFIDAFISYYRECNSLMTTSKDFLSDIGAEMWENRSSHFEPLIKGFFGSRFDHSDFDDVILVKVPDEYEYKVIVARNGNEECIVWDPQDPGPTLKFADKVDMDTL